jgi:hypothetical protein
MTTIASIGLLEDAFQRDLSWRRKEIASLYLDAIVSKGESQSRAIRGGILLTYAHLEGFVRQAARDYFSYVRGRQLRYSDLAHSFLALKISKMVNQSTAKASYYQPAVQLLLSELHEVSVLPEPEIISAKSNLSFAQFSEILYCINIDSTPFSLREKFFDEVLLDRRNAIAHGQFRRPTLTDYLEINNGVLEIIDKVEEMLVDAATARTYESATSAQGYRTSRQSSVDIA